MPIAEQNTEHFSSIVIFIVWTFTANKHMGGWIDG